MQSQVRFNRVLEKFPEKVWEALVQSQVRVLEKVPEKVPVWEASVQSQVRFNWVPEKVREKVPGSFGAKPSEVQRGPEKVAKQVPEKVLGIFGAGPGQDRISSAWLRSTLQKDLENKTLRLLGIPPIFFSIQNALIFLHSRLS